MRRFTAFRTWIPVTHDSFQKNAPDQPQFEGVIWTDGTCTIRWLTACGSTAVWNSLEDMLRIHGHPEYGTWFVWHDGAPDFPRWWTDKVEEHAHRMAGGGNPS